LEARRLQAAQWLAHGESQAAVARQLGVTAAAVNHWHQAWRAKGRPGLKGAGRAGRKPRLGRVELRQIERARRSGAEAHGFPTPLWTLPRVAALIKRLTGVTHHPGHVWAGLAGFRLVAAAARAPGPRTRRSGHGPVDGPAMVDAKENARRRHAWPVFEDDSGVSQQPVVRRTWARVVGVPAAGRLVVQNGSA
jgi:transposase